MSTTRDKLNEIKNRLEKFVPVMDGLSRARNPFELRYFVIGKHDNRIQQYKQAVIEMEAKYKACIEAEHEKKLRDIDRRRKLRAIEKATDPLDIEELELGLQKLDRDDHDALIAVTGAFKEVIDFMNIILSDFPDLVDMTEEELLRYEPEYFHDRFVKQVTVDLLSRGVVSDGNRSAMLMTPKEMQYSVMKNAFLRTEEVKRLDDSSYKEAMLQLAESYPHKTFYIAPSNYVPLKLLKDAPDGYPENRIVKIDRAEIMIATLHRPNDKLWLSETFYIPAGKNNIKHWITCESAELIGERRNQIVKDALSLGCTHVFFVDDDLVVDEGALQKLYAHDLDVVGGWYVKKTPVPESATLITTPDSTSMRPVPLDATGLVEIDWVLTAGLTLIKTDVFKRIPYPWYMTTEHGTEDTYFSARCREANIKQFLDTSVKAEHIDKANGDAYGFDGIVRGKYKHLCK